MKISVVLPVYNGIDYLEKSVSSVLAQDFTEFEFLICDDCSTDSSWNYLSTLKDSRVRLFRNEKNKGLFTTLNFLCRNSQAAIIKLWSQDDIMKADCLSETYRFHEKYKEIGFSYSERTHMDDFGEVISSNDFLDFTPEYIPKKMHDKIALFTGSIAGNISNVAVVNAKLKEAGYFDETMTICADFDMWVKLAEKSDVGKIKKPLIFLRDHSGQFSRSPKYYIRHLKEDKVIFKKLMDRSDQQMKKFGIKSLRTRKNPLYFSFFLQTLKRRDWKTAKSFIKELSENDNILGLFFRWSILKLGSMASASEPKDNKFLFESI